MFDSEWTNQSSHSLSSTQAEVLKAVFTLSCMEVENHEVLHYLVLCKDNENEIQPVI